MQQFEVRWEGPVPGTPAQVWEAFTERGDAYLWPVTFEPRVGGAERGLSTEGGVVTAWEPGRHLATRAERADGWWNQLDYWLDQLASGETWLRYRHQSVVTRGDFDAELDACRQHTVFYLHSLAEYVRWFCAKSPQYVSVDVASAAAGCAALGLGAGGPATHVVGDRVTLAGPAGARVDGVVDYVAPMFLGVRTADALVRVYGRESWGHPSSVALHLFDPAADAAAWAAAVTRAAATTATEALA